jgi:hypothetical protein
MLPRFLWYAKEAELPYAQIKVVSSPGMTEMARWLAPAATARAKVMVDSPVLCGQPKGIQESSQFPISQVELADFTWAYFRARIRKTVI